MSNIARATLGLMAATIFSKVLGFAREIALGAAYGTGIYTDAYIVAMNIPAILFSAIGAALSTTFIPLYCEKKEKYGDEKAIEFTNNVLNIVIIVSLIFSVIGIIFTKPLVRIFAIGFESEALNLAVNFTRVLLVGSTFMCISTIISGYLQIKNNFIIPGMVSIPYNIMIIIGILISVKTSPYVIVIGTLIGMSFQYIFQLPSALKNGYKYKTKINLKDSYLKKMVWLVGPVLIGVAVNQINTIIDRTLASTLVDGTITALNYANRLNGFVLGLFITSIASVIYPKLSNLSLEGTKDKFIDTITYSIDTIIIIVMPISLGAMFLSKPIVEVLFQRGQFNVESTLLTSGALSMYAIGMVSFGLIDILGKVFYSLKDTKTPMITGIISVVLNIILNIILISSMKHLGLAFATSISSIISVLILFVLLNKKIGYFGQDKIISTFTKCLFTAIIMAFISRHSYNLATTILGSGFINNMISLASSIMIGAIVYGIGIIILKVDEVNDFIKILRR